MEKVLYFIIHNWRDIAAVCVFIISVVIAIIRKKPSMNWLDNILVYVEGLLPKLIRDAEVLSDGESKMALVLRSVQESVKKKYGITLSEEVLARVKEMVEEILSTPQKK